jgi:hypothetical protein
MAEGLAAMTITTGDMARQQAHELFHGQPLSIELVTTQRIGSSLNACVNLSQHRPCVWDPTEPCPVECLYHGHKYRKRKPVVGGR